jgi:Protein of unknown function (DUF2924)
MARAVGHRGTSSRKPRVPHSRRGLWNSGAFGGLDPKTLQLLRKANGSNGVRPKPQRSQLCKGSKLFREWHGETHEVLVLDGGFAWRGETYPSLSSIARAITGAHWNGWAFFGLKRRPREAPANA